MDTNGTADSPPLTGWLATLRAQGRTVSWLATELGVSRTYLHDVASGRKHPSHELLEAITSALNGSTPDRLAQARTHAAERVRWMRIERLARELADELRDVLKADP